MAEINPIAVLQMAFPDIHESALAPLATLMSRREFPKGTLICQEGAFEDTFYVVGAGEVEFTKRFTADEDRLLRIGGPGIYFGEMALVQGEARAANVRAITDMVALEIDKVGFAGAIQTNPAMMLDIMRTLIERMRSNDATALAEMRQQKEKIEEAYERLSHQEQQRTEFLTTLAHELRTPLTAASGYMQLVKSGAMAGPALGMALQKIGTNLDRVISLVNDLLFVQEQDLIEPSLRPVSLPALVEIIIDEVADEARAHDSNIRVSVPPDLPSLQADPDGLVRAFGKVLDNAVKFSPEGGEIVIAARRLGRWIEIDFADQGIGIAETFLPHVFERFAHTDRVGDHVFGGVGLGLAIAKHIIESHGGSITVSSQPGQGSTFTVHLPLDGGRPQLRGSSDASGTTPHRSGASPWVDAGSQED